MLSFLKTAQGEKSGGTAMRSAGLSEWRITGVGYFAFADGHLTIFYMERVFVVIAIATSTEHLLCQVLSPALCTRAQL